MNAMKPFWFPRASDDFRLISHDFACGTTGIGQEQPRCHLRSLNSLQRVLASCGPGMKHDSASKNYWNTALQIWRLFASRLLLLNVRTEEYIPWACAIWSHRHFWGPIGPGPWTTPMVCWADRATFPGPDAGDPGGTIGLGGLATCVEIRSALSARPMFYPS